MLFEEVPIGAGNRVLVLIPARYASSRFPGKPLCEIAGKSMIEWVFNHCSEANDLTGKSTLKFETCVVTDDERIKQKVDSFSGAAVIVADDVISGTERVYLAAKRFFNISDYDLIINVQGDEPLISGSDLNNLAEYHLKSPFDIATIVKEQIDLELIKDPNIVKAIWSEKSGECHYFSRSQIPFGRDAAITKWYSHVGVYSYRPQALIQFCEAPTSEYEKIECLEQLRALEDGMRIGAIKTDKNFIGVDKPEDLDKLVGVMK